MTRDDILLAYYTEPKSIGSGMDDQRSAIANVVLTLVTGLIALIAIRGFSPQSSLIGGLIVILWLYGAVTTRKLYERQMFHYERSRGCLNALDESLCDGAIRQIKDKAETINRQRFPMMSLIANHQIWIALYGIVALVGALILLLSATTRG